MSPAQNGRCGCHGCAEARRTSVSGAWSFERGLGAHGYFVINVWKFQGNAKYRMKASSCRLVLANGEATKPGMGVVTILITTTCGSPSVVYRVHCDVKS